MNLSRSHKGFTLVEMLIVAFILVILVAVVLSVLSPVELLKQTRDSRRLSDLSQLDKVLNLATLDNVSMGAANTVYFSLPAINSNCSDLSLPSSTGWTYQCSNSINYRKVDGTGWVPVNFAALTTIPSALTVLPIDPTNSTSTGLYYTYVSGSWELTSLFESTKYTNKYHGLGTSTVYTLGNHQGISPNGIVTRAGTGGEGGSTVPITPSEPPEPSAHYYTTSDTWIAPAGVTSIQVEVYSGGGGGGGRNTGGSCSGGGGGAYGIDTAYAVTPTTEYTVTIGAGGNGGGSGGSCNAPSGGTSSFDIYNVQGGIGNGAGGSSSNMPTYYAGGAGSGSGGGGGSSAGNAGNGHDGNGATGGVAPDGGYAGGNGGGGAGNGYPAPSYSGGGGGAAGPSGGVGGAGGNGYVILTY